MTIDRRHFLLGAGALGGAAMLGACADDRASDANRSAANTTSTTTTGPATQPPAAVPSNGTLVVVTLDGGNDALNTVSPVHADIYRSSRGALALDPDATHDVGDGFSLHPALERTKGLWDDGKLAIVHGVGFAGLDRSHFHCMDVWQAGDEYDHRTGWLGRWLDSTDGDPLGAVAVGRRVPLTLRGNTSSGAVVPPGPFRLPRDERLRDLLTLVASADPARSPLANAVAQANADLLSVVDRVAPATADLDDASDLAAHFRTVATLIDAEMPARVYTINHPGFDTHADQPVRHHQLLDELDGALGAFIEQVSNRDVTVLVVSEFGRRVVPNANLGTDHGAAGTVLLAGTVQPGHHGDPPPLDRLDDGDLVTTTDFRSVYAGVLEGVLGVEADDILDGAPRPLRVV